MTSPIERSHRYARRLTGAVAVLFALAVGCEQESTAPDPPPGPDAPLDPVPEGLLLEGDAGESALGVLVDLPPSPIDPADARDGIYASRLIAILDVDATVGEVNEALESHGARIVRMSAVLPLVTLVVDPVEDAAAAESLASALESEVGFRRVLIVRDPDLDPDASGRSAELATAASRGGDGGAPIDAHVAASRMAAAANALTLASLQNNRVVVLVPDSYRTLAPHADIAHTFHGNGSGTHFLPRGNWGFFASGIVAAREGSAFEAFHPDPEALLDVRSVPLSGMPWPDRIAMIANLIPDGDHTVISLGATYPRSFDYHTRHERALEAVQWRYNSANDADHIFCAAAAADHGTASGANGSASFGTFLGISADHPDLMQAVANEPPDVQADVQQLIDMGPQSGIAPANIVTVGASNVGGDEEATSSRGSDVRMVGREVKAPCVVTDDDDVEGQCVEGSASYPGTRASTAQVAALAAYLWNLDPTRTPGQMRILIENAYANANTPGVVDAYIAVLSLDPTVASGATMSVRRAILDVVRGGGHPSTDRFDEDDLAKYLEEFGDSGGAAATSSTKRYDLNGDGKVGGVGTARFDLDGNAISFSTVTATVAGETRTFDETAASDIDVLCYYAHSPLYVGNTDSRDALLGTCSTADQEISVVTQAELDAIAGIREARILRVGPQNDGETSDITNLDALSKLERVGWIFIRNAPGVTTLEPLSNLHTVTNTFDIRWLDGLTSLDGLQGLIDIEGEILLAASASLESVSGLENLVSARRLGIFDCPVSGLLPLSGATSIQQLDFIQCPLVNLQGLGGLSGIMAGGIGVRDCPNLVNLAGLGGVTDILGHVTFQNCPSLTSLAGLDNVLSTANFMVIDCESFSSLSALSSLHTASFVRLLDLPGLASLSGLGNLRTVRTLEIWRTTITNLQGLGALETIVGSLSLLDNESMTSLQGLNALSGYVQSVSIVSNGAVTTLTGLGGITSVDNLLVSELGNEPVGIQSLNGLDLERIGDFTLTNCSHLHSISALAGTTIDGSITINHCNALPTLSGLGAVTALSGNFRISTATELSDLGGIGNLATVGGFLTIFDVAAPACDITELVSGIDVGGEVSIPPCADEL